MEKNNDENHLPILLKKIGEFMHNYCNENNIVDVYNYSHLCYEVFFNAIFVSLKAAINSGMNKEIVIDFASKNFEDIINNLKNIKKDL
ncbi:MAG: hypothetical protein EPO02_13180 [Nitrospirae bacterium]|nr:MAG: hypothetical protein EPO02_13180 [Nitrospirota bacterium]